MRACGQVGTGSNPGQMILCELIMRGELALTLERFELER